MEVIPDWPFLPPEKVFLSVDAIQEIEIQCEKIDNIRPDVNVVYCLIRTQNQKVYDENHVLISGPNEAINFGRYDVSAVSTEFVATLGKFRVAFGVKATPKERIERAEIWWDRTWFCVSLS